MTTRRRILIVEDETDLAELIAYNVSRHGHDPITVADGQQAINTAKQSQPDLIILDVMLPTRSGLDVARELRNLPDTQHIPIIMVTARAEDADQIAGLQVGADDYVTKPFSIKVLLARIDALLRRSATTTTEEDQTSTTNPNSPAAPHERTTFGPLTADRATHEIRCNNKLLQLTFTEFRILITLMESPNRVLNRQDLIASAMGPGIAVTARTIDVHVAAIRKKLEDQGDMIRTVRGVGYRLIQPGQPE